MNPFSDIRMYIYFTHNTTDVCPVRSHVVGSKPCSPLNLERANFYSTIREITMVTDLYIALIDLICCLCVPALQTGSAIVLRMTETDDSLSGQSVTQ